MEIETLKRKSSTSENSSRARVGKYRTLKKLRENFTKSNDSDSTNKTIDEQSIMSSSCDYISDTNSQCDNQNTESDLIKLEPDINLDFLSGDGGFLNQDDYYDNPCEQRQSARINKKKLHSQSFIELKEWAIKSEISDDALEELLDILRPIWPNLPKTVKEFLHEETITNHKKSETSKNTVVMNGNEFQAIMEKLNSMQAEIRDVASNQRNLERLVRSNNLVMRDESELSFAEKYELELPIRDVDKLFLFEGMLAKNPQCRKDFLASLSVLLEDRLSRSSLGIIRKFMHRDVILKCTAVKQMEGKFVMKLDIPTFWHAIVDILMNYHRVPEKEVHASLGTVLTNAKDWDGNRAQRDKSTGKSLNS